MDPKERFEILLEDLQGKFELVLEGQVNLQHQLHEVQEELREKFDMTAFLINTLDQKVNKLDQRVERLEQRVERLDQKIDEKAEMLSQKIDHVAAELAAHRADTGVHRDYAVYEK